MKTMWDASSPPATAPGGYDAAAGYIGGNTPHVWTVPEWKRLGGLPKLPIWVRSNPAGHTGHDDGFAALEQLYTIGCPRGSTIALDLETAIAQAYVISFNQVMTWAGFYVWVYGSRSTVFGNPACAGYWVADYTGQAHMVIGPAVRATQYAAEVIVPGGRVDQSVVRRWSWRWRLWR